MAPTGGASAYEYARRSLFEHYTLPWLSALHALDAGMYCFVLYDECKADLDTAFSNEDTSDSNQAAQMARYTLDRLQTVLGLGVAFGHEVDMLTCWLDDLGPLVDAVRWMVV